MGIPKQYKKNYQEQSPDKGLDDAYPLFAKELDIPFVGSSKFFYLVGLCVFLYAGLRILDYLDFYKNGSEIAQIFKNVKFTYRGNLAFASTANPPSPPQADSKTNQEDPKNQPAEIEKASNSAFNSKDSSMNSDPQPKSLDQKQQADQPKNSEKAEQPQEPFFDPLSITSSDDVKILETLGKRRKEIDKREEVVQKKEIDFSILEKRVNDKIKTLTDLKNKIEEDLKLIDNAEIKKIKSLATVYTSMKPKEAAHIFEGMDMSTLLSIANQMPDKKLAAIIAFLPREKARDLTLKLSQKGTELASVDKNNNTNSKP